MDPPHLEGLQLQARAQFPEGQCCSACLPRAGGIINTLLGLGQSSIQGIQKFQISPWSSPNDLNSTNMLEGHSL